MSEFACSDIYIRKNTVKVKVTQQDAMGKCWFLVLTFVIFLTDLYNKCWGFFKFVLSQFTCKFETNIKLRKLLFIIEAIIQRYIYVQR